MRCSDARRGAVDQGADPARRRAADRRSRRRRRLACDRSAPPSGSGNNSAVLYHFGSKEKLVQAIFEYRLPRLRERRATPDRRARSRRTCAVGSSARSARCSSRASSTTATYMSFVASLSLHGGEAFRHLPKRFVTAQSEFAEHLRNCITQIDEPLRSYRLDQAMTFIVQTGAQREQARARRWPVLPFALELGEPPRLHGCVPGGARVERIGGRARRRRTRGRSTERCSSECPEE